MGNRPPDLSIIADEWVSAGRKTMTSNAVTRAATLIHLVAGIGTVG